MYYDAITIILRYIDNKHGEIDLFKSINKQQIQECAYSCWAAEEIIRMILDHPTTSLDIIIDSFILFMEYCLYLSNNEATTLVFETAENTAEEILGLIL